jgi:molybdopterin molybdotransferase
VDIISVDQTLDRILGYVSVLEVEERPIMDSLGQVVAEDVYADIDVPSLDNSAMDGYAVLSVDTRDASKESPRFLRVIDTVAAGSIAGCEVEPGTAVRLMTGAPIPKGADSVVRFEDTDESFRQEQDTKIGILRQVKAGNMVRLAGEDIARGSVALSKGVVIRPPEVGILASLGCSKVKVIRRPKVAILATGDELADVGQPLPPGKIYNSNSYGLAASVLSYGGIPEVLGIAKDDEDTLVEILSKRLNADILITSAGVSQGDYDLVKDVLAKQGEVTFCTIRMQPGKRLAYGTIKAQDKAGIARNIPLIGLPGNTVSCMVASELFVRPAVLKMIGKKNLTRPTIEAIMEDEKANKNKVRIFDRVIVSKRDGRYFAKLTGIHGSGNLTSMKLANGLAIIPEDRDRVNKGDVVQVVMLDWDEGRAP